MNICPRNVMAAVGCCRPAWDKNGHDVRGLKIEEGTERRIPSYALPTMFHDGQGQGSNMNFSLDLADKATVDVNYPKLC
jgi:hypothetical protein